MKFLKKLFSLSNAQKNDFILIKLKCSNCGSIINIRVNKNYDLEQNFDEGGYNLNKEAQDDKCFRIIRISGRLDSNKKILELNADKGEILEVK